jgi:hypothetical protein
MYISKEMHDLLCNMGLFAIISILAVCVAMVLIPWIWDKTKYARMHLREMCSFKVKQIRYRMAIRQLKRINKTLNNLWGE